MVARYELDLTAGVGQAGSVMLIGLSVPLITALDRNGAVALNAEEPSAHEISIAGACRLVA